MTEMGLGAERVPARERIASLDVMRGIAILFILFMNIPWMAHYQPHINDPRLVSWTGADQGGFVFTMLLLGTQRGLLELLFGAGILIMARKAMQPDAPVAIADLHYRRNLLLIAFGLFNALVLLWGGDILLPYGLAALLLFHCRLWSPRVQLLAAAILLLLASIPGAIHYAGRIESRAAAQQVAAAKQAGRTVDEKTKAKAEEWRKAVANTLPAAANPEKRKQVAEIHATRSGPLPAYVTGAWKDWLMIYEGPIFFPIMAEILGTMLLGMALFQLGILQGRARRSTYAVLLLLGYGIGVAVRVAGLQEILAFTPRPKLWWITQDATRIAIVMGHIGLVHLLLRSAAGRMLLAPFRAPGRMPLSVYLFTSFLTMWVLFPGFGLGLHGRWGFGGMTACAAVIIAAELVAANLWMRRFETGPLEWAWKSLAYGRRMPFRRSPERPGPEPVAAAAE
jgi:uncharacterized protein